MPVAHTHGQDSTLSTPHAVCAIANPHGAGPVGHSCDLQVRISQRTMAGWAYYYRGTYYLYVLITGNSRGEGFGVASSVDGVRWRDHDRVLLVSDQMVRYPGTGAAWKSADFGTIGSSSSSQAPDFARNRLSRPYGRRDLS